MRPRPAPPPHAPDEPVDACTAGAGAKGVEPMGGSDAGRSAQNVGAATGRGRRSGLAERGAGGRRPEHAGRARRRRQTGVALWPSGAAVGRREAAAEGTLASANSAKPGCRRPARERPHAEDGCRRPAREVMPAEESPAAPWDSHARGGPRHARPGGTSAADATAVRRDVSLGAWGGGASQRPSRQKSGRRTVATATLFSSLSGLSSFSPCSPADLATTPGPSRLSRRGHPRT